MIKSDKETKGSYEPITKVKEGHQELLQKIGSELEKIRGERNLSVNQLCAKIGMSRTTYYRISKGLIYFNIQKFLDLLDELDTELKIDFKNKAGSKPKS